MKAAESFAYTTAIQHLDCDLAYLGDHLAAQIAEWCAEVQVDQPSVKDRPTVPASPAIEV